MQIILLCGGSGKRLWPLSNGVRSKQFLQLFMSPEGKKESMLQRVVRQIKESGIADGITVATGSSQYDAIISQLGDKVEIVVEPERRDTFPAIALAAEYLVKVKKLADDEVVAVMPCDPFTDAGYYETIGAMAGKVRENLADMVLMGITPDEPSSKFGYLLPESPGAEIVSSFVEKPDAEKARKFLELGAVWNGGVFAFRLGYIREIAERYLDCASFEEFADRYSSLPKISFDYEIAEKAESVGVVYFSGRWKDLGTWETLAEELNQDVSGNAHAYMCSRTTIVNELSLPVVCHGTSNIVVAASPDGILVVDKDMAQNVKESVGQLEARPMYEERRWGTYKVIDHIEFGDGFRALTKQLTLNPGCSISYQRHECRDEVWTFIDGHGELVIDGVRRDVGRGDTVTIERGTLHALRARSPLTFIEVQRGSNLVEEDIERFAFDW